MQVKALLVLKAWMTVASTELNDLRLKILLANWYADHFTNSRNHHKLALSLSRFLSHVFSCRLALLREGTLGERAFAEECVTVLQNRVSFVTTKVPRR